jgi:DNA-binding NarL/FixJ family response regulator
VVGQATTGEEARGQVKRLHPDLLVLDCQLGDGEAERTIVDVKASLPGCAVLMVADHETGRESGLIEAGASGVVSKSISGAELAETARAVVCGANVVGFSDASSRHGGSGLSARERAVLALMTAGLTNAEIGSKLFLATKTVERQVATIVRKLGARNRAHAGAIAVARHLVEPSEIND